MSNCHDNTKIYATNSTNPARSGSYLFKFYGPYGGQTQYLISPELSSSLTGIDVSFYYNLFVTSSSTRTFNVGYSTTDNEITSFTWEPSDFSVTKSDKNWYKFANSYPTGTKYIAIRYTGNNVNFFIDDFYIEKSETYKRPKNFSLDSYTSSSATFSWTAGSDESAWQIAYSTKEDFDPETEGAKVSVTDNPYTLSGLIEGVTYYAYVRSNYSGNYSEWCDSKLEFTPYMDLTINDGSTTCYYAPVYGYKANYDFKSQIIIPKESLNDLVDRKLTQFTFYASQSSLNWGTASFDVYLNEVENTSYAKSPVFESWGTKVCTNANLSINGNEMLVVFDIPYLYGGGNLMIGFELTTTGSSATSSWYGVSGTDNVAYYYYGSSYTTSRAGHLPKVTIRALSPTLSVTLGTNGYTTFASPRPLDLTDANIPAGLNAYKATVDGTTVRFTKINQTVAANTGVLLEGTAGQTYNIPVAESGTAVDGNEFLVNSTGGTFTADDGYTYYGMIKATENTDPLVFGTFAPGTVAIPSNKAYLKVADSDGTRQLNCVFEEGTTGIRTVNSEKLIMNSSVYNLNGQKVEKAKKGIYIIDGRKKVIK